MRHLDLLVAAPGDPSSFAGWGDVAFAQSLQRAFRAADVATRLLFRDTYERALPPPCPSSLLVLRGKFRPKASWLECSPYQERMLWQISWPLDVSRQELSDYDRLFVASPQDRQRLAYLSGRPTHVLLQATDFCRGGSTPAPSLGLLFVGNTRGVDRPLVRTFASSDLPLTVIGSGWDSYGIQAERPSISNHDLPELYARSFAVLNDHHRAMREFGYLNNRVFDVLACGVPVISDAAPGCPDALRPGVFLHGPQDDPVATIAAVMQCREEQGILQTVSREVAAQHRFENRVNSILAACSHDVTGKDTPV